MLSASEFCAECSYSAFVETNNCDFGIMKRVCTKLHRYYKIVHVSIYCDA